MPAGRRLADSHLTCPLSMHAVGPPPFPRNSHVSRQAGGQARAFRRAPNHTSGSTIQRIYYEAMDADAPGLPVREWDEQLRARGYRVTPQRQLVLEAVARLAHATPEEIGAQVHHPPHLPRAGPVGEVRQGPPPPPPPRPPTYHLASAGDHVHLVCRDCGRV